MSRKIEVEAVYLGQNLVGESPVWSKEEGALYWVDVRAPAIHRRSAAGVVTSWKTPDVIGPIAFTGSGKLVGGMPGGYYSIDLARNSFNPIVSIEKELDGHRLNDGKCDRKGRFWGGTRGPLTTEPVGGLYCITTELEVRLMDTGFIIPNGLAFSPDDRTMIVADTAADIVYRYDFDLASGTISNRRTFFSTQDHAWRVDGATFDSDGYYWCALLQGGAVGRFDPDGRLDKMVELPVRHPTMCCFGGEDLDTLYVTSGTIFLTEEERAAKSLAGSLFAIHGTGAVGIAEPWFGGHLD